MFDSGNVGTDLSSAFDDQFGEQNDSFQPRDGIQEVNQLSLNEFQSSFIERNEDIFQHYDPLIKSNQFQCEPFDFHWVDPHYVSGYVREDGTVVKGYIRDGNGSGYLRGNPDK